jgi:hypothetical protein
MWRGRWLNWLNKTNNKIQVLLCQNLYCYLMKATSFLLILLSFSLTILGQSETEQNRLLKKSRAKKLIGLTINQVIKKLSVDTLNLRLQQEPPGVARGIKIEMKDSSVFFLFIKRRETWVNDAYHILNDTITGVGIAYKNCRKKTWGTGFIWWGISNPYCKPPLKRKRWWLKQEGMLEK